MSESREWRPLEVHADAEGLPSGADGVLEYVRSGDFGDLLVKSKAVVFRGFGLAEDTLEPVMDELLPGRLAYLHGTSPRTKVGDNVYTSTEYPQELTISMHNELSYAHRWPSRLMFCCTTTPGSGGATPVVDGVRWLGSLDAEVRDAFAGGVRYTQNLHDGLGLGLSWKTTFETESREEVEKFLADTEAEWEWRSDGTLRIVQHRPATIRHPVTGDEVWFNQADQFHPAALGDETAAELAEILPPEELPQSVTYADGTPIPAEHVIHVRDVALDVAVDVDWVAGDLMIIDNVAVGHGRRPFTGDRRVLVAMS
ncbi:MULTISPECIES: TauD/TfdA family dioxygenase [Actinomadura]|uniref:TauD/TfdA-like domain-containing protein n=1 Tax=Actinomadura litoris TaxID=2678616 RepID=A0A7K1KXB0_9ACTN|nr:MULTISPECIES: TauD/TfdA family dioxygenase [Actinomadura]MBT2209343.1 TauD/TfdA family dioxygenase [Actinomadura sp. NEAU-AAG7]MUN36840.1 hypothetical protein [Actinomadura litoris]